MNQIQGNDTCSMTHCGWACVVLTCVAHSLPIGRYLNVLFMKETNGVRWCANVLWGLQILFQNCFLLFYVWTGMLGSSKLSFSFHTQWLFCLYYHVVPCKSSIISSSIMYIWAPVIFNPNSLLLAQIVI